VAPDSRPARIDIRDVEIIAPNFKRRLSGVTSTIVQLIPYQVKMGIKIAALGPGLPDNLPKLRWIQLMGLWKPPAGRNQRIWHARRNNEMAFGLFLKNVLRMPLKLVFTSAAQRQHTRYTRWLIRQMDDVIATSARSGSFLEVRHTVIKHGVDLELFHPPSGDEDTVGASGLPGKYLIGCFGRVRHQKGTDLFVEAAIKLLPKYPDWTAVISGRVTSEHITFANQLKSKIQAAGLSDRIVFLGEVPDIRIWYRRLALYVAPSRNEGFGLTPIEAMASQTVVVASDAGAYSEMIEEGVNGSITPAGDAEALTRAIENYLKDPHGTLKIGIEAHRSVRRNFALGREATNVGHIYEELLS